MRRFSLLAAVVLVMVMGFPTVAGADSSIALAMTSPIDYSWPGTSYQTQRSLIATEVGDSNNLHLPIILLSPKRGLSLRARPFVVRKVTVAPSIRSPWRRHTVVTGTGPGHRPIFAGRWRRPISFCFRAGTRFSFDSGHRSH